MINKLWEYTLITVLFVLIFILMIYHVNAHSFYHTECCSGRDCAPVIKLVDSPAEKGKWATTIYGTVLVPYSYEPIRPSKDGQMHVCIVKDMYSGLPSLRCVYDDRSV